MSLLLAGCAVLFFSVLGIGCLIARIRAITTVVFMLAAGASLMTGFYWYDTYTNNLGLSIAMMLIAYSLICVGFGFGCLFRRGKSAE